MEFPLYTIDIKTVFCNIYLWTSNPENAYSLSLDYPLVQPRLYPRCRDIGGACRRTEIIIIVTKCGYCAWLIIYYKGKVKIVGFIITKLDSEQEESGDRCRKMPVVLS